ncbi:hypothetical protein B0T24DRAFT_589022 [Lasiosphaeria ovina]|uniref:Hydrophobin n=1 Tax=Lasiosphaeria ovina TaxID=92902 RepID=A0AAE0TYQ7_9PEZI|nr:hypothetical protein B0T24DRAFT_589022 [Lasiosphaeria ovina]
MWAAWGTCGLLAPGRSARAVSLPVSIVDRILRLTSSFNPSGFSGRARNLEVSQLSVLNAANDVEIENDATATCKSITPPGFHCCCSTGCCPKTNSLVLSTEALVT